jgi:ketosteroid isomerase-like protein
MKFFLKVLLLVVLLGPFASFAQSIEIDQKRIETLITDLYRAMVEKDRVTLDNLTAETLSYGHSSGAIENKSEYVAAIMNGQFEFISIDTIDQYISISGDTAILRHIFNAKGKNDGKQVDVHIGVMMTLQKQEGAWKLLARQAYKQ